MYYADYVGWWSLDYTFCEEDRDGYACWSMVQEQYKEDEVDRKVIHWWSFQYDM